MDQLLPTTDAELVAQFQSEYTAAFSSGTEDELEAAKCRLIWVLVHSSSKAHVQRGLELATTSLERDQRSGNQDREMRYYKAVALYKLGRFLDARSALGNLLSEYPGFRQGEALKEVVDQKVIQDGVIGLGVAGAIAAGVIGIIVAATRKS